jgi:hypothetical protein
MKRMSYAMFFTEFVGLCIDSYMELLISGFFNLQEKNVLESDLSGDVISAYACYMCLIFSLIILPIMIIYVFSQDIERMKSRKFEKRWGPFYSEIRSNSKA